MPKGLIAGWFDKGPTALWYACPNLFIHRMWNTLFCSAGRFKRTAPYRQSQCCIHRDY